MRKRHNQSPPYQATSNNKSRRKTRAQVIAALIPPPVAQGIKSTAYLRSDLVSETIAYLKRGTSSPSLPHVGSAPILDWNPAAGVTVSGGFVSAILDQSGHGNTGTPTPSAIGGTGGTVVASDAAFAGKPSIAFSQALAKPQGLIANPFSGYASGGFTVFIAWIDLATPGADPGGFIYSGNGFPTGHLTSQAWDQLSTASAGGNTDALVEDTNTSSFNIAPDWALTGAGALYVHQDAGTNASHIVRLNGSTKARGSTLSALDPGPGPAGTQTWVLASGPGARRTGRFARVLIYPSALSGGDIALVEAYFTANYGV
jgi:hypothetical protein